MGDNQSSPDGGAAAAQEKQAQDSETHLGVSTGDVESSDSNSVGEEENQGGSAAEPLGDDNDEARAAPIDECLDAAVTATDSDAGGKEGEPGAEGEVVRDQPADEGEAPATVVAIHESGTKDEDEASHDDGEPAAPIDERLDAVVTATDSDAGGQEGEPGAEGGVVRDEPVDEGEAAATVVAIHESGTKDEDEASNDNGEPAAPIDERLDAAVTATDSDAGDKEGEPGAEGEVVRDEPADGEEAAATVVTIHESGTKDEAAPMDERLDAAVTATDSDAGGREGEPGAEGEVVRDQPADEGEAAATVVAIHESGTKDEAAPIDERLDAAITATDSDAGVKEGEPGAEGEVVKDQLADEGEAAATVVAIHESGTKDEGREGRIFVGDGVKKGGQQEPEERQTSAGGGSPDAIDPRRSGVSSSKPYDEKVEKASSGAGNDGPGGATNASSLGTPEVVDATSTETILGGGQLLSSTTGPVLGGPLQEREEDGDAVNETTQVAERENMPPSAAGEGTEDGPTTTETEPARAMDDVAEGGDKEPDEDREGEENTRNKGNEPGKKEGKEGDEKGKEGVKSEHEKGEEVEEGNEEEEEEESKEGKYGREEGKEGEGENVVGAEKGGGGEKGQGEEESEEGREGSKEKGDNEENEGGREELVGAENGDGGGGEEKEGTKVEDDREVDESGVEDKGRMEEERGEKEEEEDKEKTMVLEKVGKENVAGRKSAMEEEETGEKVEGVEEEGKGILVAEKGGMEEEAGVEGMNNEGRGEGRKEGNDTEKKERREHVKEILIVGEESTEKEKGQAGEDGEGQEEEGVDGRQTNEVSGEGGIITAVESVHPDEYYGESGVPRGQGDVDSRTTAAAAAAEVAKAEAGSARALEALGIAAQYAVLDPADLRSLSAASLKTCAPCRGGGRTFHVRVTTKTPLYVWSPLPRCESMVIEAADGGGEMADSSPVPAPGVPSLELDEGEDLGTKTDAEAVQQVEEDESSDERRKREGLHARSRVPGLLVSHITWDRPDEDLREEFARELPRDLETLTFGFGFNRTLDGVEVNWPPRIKALHFSATFNPRLASGTPRARETSTAGRGGGAIGKRGGAERGNGGGGGGAGWAKFLPLGLEEITFGTHFNQPVEGVQWPPGLKRLHFGANFKKDIEAADWPDTVEELTFGSYFNMSVKGTRWPSSLRKLTFGSGFNQPIEKCRFPAGLEEITFGTHFNQPIDAVRWPPALRLVTFGDRFNHPVVGSEWSTSLTRLTFGRAFDQKLPQQRQDKEESGTWPPASLECVIVGSKFSADARASEEGRGQEDRESNAKSRGRPDGERRFSIVRRASPRRERRRKSVARGGGRARKG